VAGETNWSRLNTDGFQPGLGSPPRDTLEQGNRYGQRWIPAETDVSIRPGWFYSPSTDSQVKSVEALMDIDYTSFGRNSNLLLNVPPDRRGRIHPTDSARLMEFRQARDKAFANNLLTPEAAIASKQTRRGKAFAASNIADGNYHSYWAATNNSRTATIDIDLQRPQTFNRLLIQEYIPLGQRVAAFSLEALDSNQQWHSIANGTTIGYKRILRFEPVTAQKLRINITDALATPLINAAELYFDPLPSPKK
jgi:alpha-L-fucosidase